MIVAYLHHYYFAPVRVVVYAVICAVMLTSVMIARRFGDGDTGPYGGVPGQGSAPTPDSPYAASGDQSSQGRRTRA